MTVAAAHRAHEIEAGRTGVAGLDAVDAFDIAEQAIVVADRLAAIIEHGGREITVVARIAILDRAAEGRLIARRGQLLVVRQARRVAVGGFAHAERPRLARHQLGEFGFIAGDGFRDHDGGVVGGTRHQALDRILDLERLARLQTELGRRLFGGVLGDFHLGVQLHLAGVEALEQQIKRHDLG